MPYFFIILPAVFKEHFHTVQKPVKPVHIHGASKLLADQDINRNRIYFLVLGIHDFHRRVDEKHGFSRCVRILVGNT